MAEEKKRRFWSDVFLFAILGAIGGAILNGFTESDFSLSSAGVFANPLFILAGAGALGAVMLFIKMADKIKNPLAYENKDSKKGLGDYDKKSKDEQQFYHGKLLTAQDLRTKFASCMYSQLGKIDLSSKRNFLGDPYSNSGIVVKCEMLSTKKDIEVVLNIPIHTMVIGNTGSGKTQGYIDPTIQILSELPVKSSMMISDSKGELYDKHSEKLRANGYNVVVLDLANPMRSDRWNPFDRAYLNYMRLLNLRSEIKPHTGGHPTEFKLKFQQGVVFGQTWYEFDRAAYPTLEQVEGAVRGTEQALTAQISTDVGDICNVIVPKGGSKDAMWEDGARDLCKAVIFSMLEDFKDPEMGMTHDKFNLFNFYTIINHRDPGNNPFKSIGEYVKGRSVLFKVSELAGTVINAPDTTRSSYASVLGTAIGFLADPGIAYVTSGSEINFKTFDDPKRPCAFFIRIPDDKITMHKIASIAIEQLYKDLTDLANKSPTLALSRYFHFIIDEFANIPKIEGMSSYVTISRSRKIIFHLVIQSYEQLAAKYDTNDARGAADTIKANCNNHIFMGSGDFKTVEEFSKKCGNTVVRVENKNVSRQMGGDQKKDGGRNVSESEQFQTRPIIFPEELQRLEKGTAVIICDKTSPFYAKMTFGVFAKHIYKFGHALEKEFRPDGYLDIERISYDMNNYIKKRNGASSGGTMGGSNPFENSDW